MLSTAGPTFPWQLQPFCFIRRDVGTPVLWCQCPLQCTVSLPLLKSIRTTLADLGEQLPGNRSSGPPSKRYAASITTVVPLLSSSPSMLYSICLISLSPGG